MAEFAILASFPNMAIWLNGLQIKNTDWTSDWDGTCRVPKIVFFEKKYVHPCEEKVS